MSQNEMDEKWKDLEEEGIISCSEWETVSEHTRKMELRINNTKIDMFLNKGCLIFKIGDLAFHHLKETKIETESELFGLEPSDDEELYFVFVNQKDDVVAYIPLEESEVSE